jgi:hypothetical protein
MGFIFSSSDVEPLRHYIDNLPLPSTVRVLLVFSKVILTNILFFSLRRLDGRVLHMNFIPSDISRGSSYFLIS